MKLNRLTQEYNRKTWREIFSCYSRSSNIMRCCN